MALVSWLCPTPRKKGQMIVSVEIFDKGTVVGGMTALMVIPMYAKADSSTCAHPIRADECWRSALDCQLSRLFVLIDDGILTTEVDVGEVPPDLASSFMSSLGLLKLFSAVPGEVTVVLNNY